MRVIGLTMVRNEEDVVDHVVRHMLSNDLDLVVVADNLSTDQTRSILDSIDDERLIVVDDNDPSYRQSEKTTALANHWASQGDWVISFDADELWNTLDGRTLGEVLRSAREDVVVGYPRVHVPQRDDAHNDCPFLSIPHRVTSNEFWPKAAIRWGANMAIEQGNHWTRSYLPDTLDIRHFQYRSYDHLATKVRNGAAALGLANLPANSGAHWRHLSSMTDEELAEWWDAHVNQAVVLDHPRCLA